MHIDILLVKPTNEERLQWLYDQFDVVMGRMQDTIEEQQRRIKELERQLNEVAK